MALTAYLQALAVPEGTERDIARQKRRAAGQKWRAKNKERIRAYNAKWREDARADPVKWEKLNQDARRRTREWTKKNPERSKDAIRRWSKTANGRAASAAKERRARATNPVVAIKHRLRARIALALKRKEHKSASTEALLGCSFVDFKLHLESLFVGGMSWDNRSEWHIDHIRPCASFNLLDPEQQRRCFHYTNMQPLWKQDNLSKGDRWAV